MSMEKVKVPVGKSGEREVKHFTVTEAQASLDKMRSMVSGMPDRAVVAGIYTMLTCSGAIVMSDTPAEMADHYNFYRKAKGHVLIAGLGLGMIANAVASKPDVISVTILEISPDVIKLVGSTVHKKCKIVQADVMEYVPNRKYDYMRIDIWNDICKDNLDVFSDLEEYYEDYADWVGGWSIAQLERMGFRAGW